MKISATLDEIRDFVYRNVVGIRELLHQNPSRSKAALAAHMGQLVLTPTETPSGSVYEVSDGGMNLLPGKDVMPLVARDGIEPPTPAFSGLASSNSGTDSKGLDLLGWSQLVPINSPNCPTALRHAAGIRAQTAGKYPTWYLPASAA